MIELVHTLTGHQNPIYTLEVMGDKLYSAGNDKGVVEWTFKAGEVRFSRVLCNVPSSVYALHAIPNTSWLAIGMRTGELFIIDTVANSIEAKLKIEKGAVFALSTVSKKNELIAVGDEGKVHIWDITTRELLYTFRVANSTIRTIAIDEKEDLLAFADKDGMIYLYDLKDFHLISSAKTHDMAITSLLFRQGKLLSGGRDAKMKKSKLSDLTVEQEIVPHLFTVYGIQAIDAQSFVTISRDKTIKLWSDDFKLLKNISRDKGIDAHHLSINAQAYNPTDRLLATAGDDKMIKVWQVK